MKALLDFFRRGSNATPAAAPDLFDIYHEKTMGAVLDSRGRPLGEWSVSDADDSVRAARFVLGVLRSDRRRRARFPRALSGDDNYRQWLLSEGARAYGLSAAAGANVQVAFTSEPGAAVREFYLHNPEVQWRYPVGLLPVGQKRMVKWLLGQGRAQHQLTDEQILWFLHETAEDLPRHIALTYQVNPEWQERFGTGRELLAFLRSKFPKYQPLRKVKEVVLPVRAPEGPGVNLLSHFCYPSGLQQAALSYKQSLERVGFQTSCRDVPTGVRTELASRTSWLGFEDYPVTITNVAPVPHFPVRYRRAGLAPKPGVVQIAYWWWELDAIPDEWVELGDTVTEVWTSTPFVAAAMRTKMRVPVVDMLLGISISEVEEVSRAQLGLGAEEFVFLCMFDMRSDFERKNPLAAVLAFRRAFAPDEGAALVVKVSRGESDPENLALLKEAAGGHRVVIVDEVVSRAAAYGFVAMSDCVVSLHRAEGFGLPLAEGMLLGKPVIGTNYSGNTAFMTPENSLLVDYELVNIERGGAIYHAGYRWAEPSEEHAAACMRRVFEDREAARALGRKGQVEATELLSIEAAGARMKARIEQLMQQR